MIVKKGVEKGIFIYGSECYTIYQTETIYMLLHYFTGTVNKRCKKLLHHYFFILFIINTLCPQGICPILKFKKQKYKIKSFISFCTNTNPLNRYKTINYRKAH